MFIAKTNLQISDLETGYYVIGSRLRMTDNVNRIFVSYSPWKTNIYSSGNYF